MKLLYVLGGAGMHGAFRPSCIAGEPKLLWLKKPTEAPAGQTSRLKKEWVCCTPLSPFDDPHTLQKGAEVSYHSPRLAVGEVTLYGPMLPMPLRVAWVISASVLSLTSASVTGLTFTTLPTPALASPSTP